MPTVSEITTEYNNAVVVCDERGKMTEENRHRYIQNVLLLQIALTLAEIKEELTP